MLTIDADSYPARRELYTEEVLPGRVSDEAITRLAFVAPRPRGGWKINEDRTNLSFSLDKSS